MKKNVLYCGTNGPFSSMYLFHPMLITSFTRAPAELRGLLKKETPILSSLWFCILWCCRQPAALQYM